MAQASQIDAPTEVLAGLVERVVFHNPESGFCVLRVAARGRREAVTIVGHAPLISPGEFVQASGNWANDRAHGVQFRAAFLKPAAPTTREGIEKYLGSGMLRGIGPVYAKKLLHAFGDAVFNVIENEPYPAVVIPLATTHYPMLQRNLIYTGVTRGKRLVVLLGQRRALAIAVRGAHAKRRWSKLREWLENR